MSDPFRNSRDISVLQHLVQTTNHSGGWWVLPYLHRFDHVARIPAN